MVAGQANGTWHKITELCIHDLIATRNKLHLIPILTEMSSYFPFFVYDIIETSWYIDWFDWYIYQFYKKTVDKYDDTIVIYPVSLECIILSCYYKVLHSYKNDVR